MIFTIGDEMHRVFWFLIKLTFASMLLSWLLIGSAARGRDLIYGYGQYPLFPAYDNLLYLSILPGTIAVVWILRSFEKRFIPLKLLLCANLVLVFGFVLPESIALLHPFSRAGFPDVLEAACLEEPVQGAEPYTAGRAGPHRLAPAGSLAQLYAYMPEEWKSRSLVETQLVLCSDGRKEVVLDEQMYAVPYLKEGLWVQRVQYVEHYRLVAADNGQTISRFTGYGGEPPEFPETLYPSFDFFRKPDQPVILYGDEITYRGIGFWLYRFIYPAPRVPGSVL
jgi:hypothetical protein